MPHLPLFERHTGSVASPHYAAHLRPRRAATVWMERDLAERAFHPLRSQLEVPIHKICGVLKCDNEGHILAANELGEDVVEDHCRLQRLQGR
jgi:ribosomal protein L18E